MTQLTRRQTLAYEARRVAQTRRTFANWPTLLSEMAGEALLRVPRSAGVIRVGRKSGGTLTFVTRSGQRLSCPNVPGARLPLYEQFADDCYDVAWLLGRQTEKPLQVLDVGAHVGAFATHLAGSRPDVRVECYEPSPESARFLRGNVAANGLGERVRVYEQAMSAQAGTALLDDNSGGSVHNGLVTEDHRLVDGADGLGARRTISVTTTTFDDAVGAARAPFDVVKMDCEGGEYGLVYASSPHHWLSVQRVVMEYHPVTGESWPQLRSWFAEVGLHVVREKSEDPGLGTAWLARDATGSGRAA